MSVRFETNILVFFLYEAKYLYRMDKVERGILFIFTSAFVSRSIGNRIGLE